LEKRKKKTWFFSTGGMPMFTEDYLMRMISQAMAVLMTSIGLRKAGKYSEARQAIQQAIEQLTTLPADLVDQMEDGSVLNMLSAQGQMDLGRLAILADLYQEQGEILVRLDKPAQGSISFARALRFTLECTLSEAADITTENIARIEGIVSRLNEVALPVETHLALSDYYQRLLEKDEKSLAAEGISRKQVSQTLARLQERSASSQNPIG
jgi:hypothetical protein